MKKIVIFLTFFSSCSSLQKLNLSNVSSVYILYESDTWNNYDGYQLHDNEMIKWDKNNKYVKIALNNYLEKIDNLKYKNANYLSNYIENKKTMNYNSIKVTQLKEFGYIKLFNGEVLLYGIIGERTFIDLTNNIVYYK